jgi:hypothetical protein
MLVPRARSVLVPFLVGLAGPLVTHADGQPGSPPAAVVSLDPTGKPAAFQAGKQPMVAVWYDDRWHVAVTNKGGKKAKGEVFTGSVRADKGLVVGQFKELEKHKDGRADWILPHRDGGGFDFHFTTFGFVDKAGFTAPDATRLTFDVQLNGKPAPQVVFVGAAGKHPDVVPFTLPAKP